MALAKLAEEIQERIWEQQALREEELNAYNTTHPKAADSKTEYKKGE